MVETKEDIEKIEETKRKDFEKKFSNYTTIPKIPSRKETRKLWDAMKEIIEDNYDKLFEEDLRNGYYIIKNKLVAKYSEKISLDAIKFAIFNPEAYKYYRSQVWASIEKKGYEKPEAYPRGIIYWNGVDYLPRQISSCYGARGFLYVEKNGVAKKLKELSKYGWAVVTCSGNCTRNVRELLKETGKRVEVFRDFDSGGLGIYTSIRNKTLLTKHLDINLGKQAHDLGLNQKQVEYLIEKYGINKDPIPKKDIKKWPVNYRIELSCFNDIETEYGSENMYLEFVISLMKAKGLILSEEETSKEKTYRYNATLAFEKQVREIINQCRAGKEMEGTAVDLVLEEDFNFSEILNNPEVVDAISKVLEKHEDKCTWIDETEKDEELVGDIPAFTPRNKKKSIKG